MRDHRYIRESGEIVPVAAMTDQELVDALNCEEYEVTNRYPGDSVEAFMERIRIEQTIRSLGLWIPPEGA